MSTLAIIVLSLAVTTVPADLTDPSASAKSTRSIHLAQAEPEGCCRRWDKRSRIWRKIGTSKTECVKLNQRFDRREKDADIVKQQGQIWWDQKCDNKKP